VTGGAYPYIHEDNTLNAYSFRDGFFLLSNADVSNAAYGFNNNASRITYILAKDTGIGATTRNNNFVFQPGRSGRNVYWKLRNPLTTTWSDGVGAGGTLWYNEVCVLNNWWVTRPAILLDGTAIGN
jgi:hypothetical protein